MPKIIVDITDKQDAFLKKTYGVTDLTLVMSQIVNDVINARVQKEYTPKLTTDQMIDSIAKP